MARIRTIKPEFFTSEDIVSLSPLARLLYIAVWCEADKEGRLAWKPMTFKLRYFPGDTCDIQALCKELVDSGLVRLYGNGLACVPQFSKHQHVNPRESASSLPAPDATPNSTRHEASARVNSEIDPQVGREGKGREGNSEPIGSGGAPPIELPKDELWKAGKSLLNQAGMPAAQCGSFVGKLVKDYGDVVVVDAVRAAVVARPADPAEYLKAACMRGAGQRGAAEPAWRAEQRVRTHQAAPGVAAGAAPADQFFIDMEVRNVAPRALG
ncbi:hypothetical protein VLK31_34825 [Variovorax sp. H27-G14]|uniref:hypothetical protein n=1 Tax=Variovorax sp. H27-G14 TaxID=3111914 RepID=UPI0038FC37F4